MDLLCLYETKTLKGLAKFRAKTADHQDLQWSCHLQWELQWQYTVVTNY